MEHLDEHEMLIEYSEMSAFDFNSEEFQKIRRDYMECKDFVSEFFSKLGGMFGKNRPVRTW